MVVRQQHQVDRRQRLEGDPRFVVTLRTCPAQRAGPRRPDGVDQDVAAVHLEQEAGVSDQRRAEVGDSGRRHGLLCGGCRPACALSAEAPAEQVWQAAVHLGMTGVEEPLAVVVIGGRTLGHALVGWEGEADGTAMPCIGRKASQTRLQGRRGRQASPRGCCG